MRSLESRARFRTVVNRIEPTTPARSGAFEPDRVVHLVAADDYRVHQRGFLFAPLALIGGVHAVLVRPFDVATRFAEGQEFRMLLRAMPAVKCAGRRRSIGAARAKRVRLEGTRRPFGFDACVYRPPRSA